MSIRHQYFRKFPLIAYNGEPAVNILRRVDFNNKVKDFYTAFYETEIKDGERIETIAYDYYDDVDLDWLIYHTNDIIDPYHDVPLEDSVFLQHIKNKYGSIEKAQAKTFVYRNNYRGDISVLSYDGYNALPTNHKKYYDPVSNVSGVRGYQRKKEEMYASTNMNISYSFSSEVANTFDIDELVRFSDSVATVSAANTSAVILKHVSGDWSTMTTNFDVTGDDSKQTINFDHSTYTLLQNVIPADEQVYFSPYSYFDLELEKNELKRNIYLVDDSYTVTLNDQLDNLMK